jgi:phage terminase large subunit-like protein
MSNKPLFSPASKKQALMIQRAKDTQVTIIGGAAGSGKSYILQMLPLLFVDDPRSNMVMFRRTNPQIKGAGGIFETGCGIYNQLPEGQRPKIKTGDLEVIFPTTGKNGKLAYNGAKLKYQQAENVAQSKLNAQGLQWTFVGVDEGTQFEWEQLEYFMSRLRSESKHFSRMVISCNPDPDHKIKEMISWYLNDDGYPDPEKDGVVRYFIQRDGDYHWGDTREELAKKFNIPEKDWQAKILSFSFVSATIFDNPPMIENNPSYLAFLEGLNERDKAQLLHGCWAEFAYGGKYFKREWVKELDRIPYGVNCCRAYDFGASERTTANKNPDPTTSIKMYKDKEGNFILAGEYHEEFLDEVDNIQGAIYQSSGQRDMTMLKQAAFDGVEVPIVAPQDPAAAGKALWLQQAKFFAENGYIFKKDPMPITKSKLTKFLPFATSAENGLVYIVKSTMTEKTYNYIMAQLERFDGGRSTNTKRDDFADCIASAYNYLCTARYYSTPYIPDINAPTKLSNYKQ